MNRIKEKIVWLVGAFLGLFFIYILGRRDGKNAEETKTAKKSIETIKKKNAISARVSNSPSDKLRYRD